MPAVSTGTFAGKFSIRSAQFEVLAPRFPPTRPRHDRVKVRRGVEHNLSVAEEPGDGVVKPSNEHLVATSIWVALATATTNGGHPLADDRALSSSRSAGPLVTRSRSPRAVIAARGRPSRTDSTCRGKSPGSDRFPSIASNPRSVRSWTPRPSLSMPTYESPRSRMGSAMRPEPAAEVEHHLAAGCPVCANEIHHVRIHGALECSGSGRSQTRASNRWAP